MSLIIKPSSVLKTIIFGFIPILIVLGFITTGYKYVPVEYTVGKCLKDYTNAASYKGRSSKLKTTDFKLEEVDILMCYGSPEALDHNIYGDQVPFDQLWEFGANEPTRIYTNKDIVLGELEVPKGRYSIYAIPGKWNWEVFISKSTDHWGNEITTEVRNQEIGSFKVRPQYNSEFVNELTIRPSQNEIIAEWGKTRIRIPIENIDSGEKTKHLTIISKFFSSL